MKAISTRYLGPTDRNGDRVKANDGDGNTITIPWDYAQSNETNHQFAALALAGKMQWGGTMHGGHTRNGMVWVFEGGPRFEIGKDHRPLA